jgi:hypothetical protein
MKFKSGESGNPAGRPKGAISKRLQLSRLLEPHAEELITKVVELAKGGEINALRFCIERLVPKPKDEPIEFELPEGDLKHTETLLQLGAGVIAAVSDGELTPEQGNKITVLIETQRKTIETCNLETRLKEIETVLNQRN